MEMTKENKMGTMKIPKLLYSISVPIIISMLVEALYNIVDSIFVAQYDNVAGTGALTLAFPIQMLMIAVGGGVVGDLTGFAASTYMRGIDFFNVPTTLLSQVDSSVGGKCAINLDGIKNIIGSFYPPRGVLIDTDTLKTLPKRQLASGLCEAIKMSATFSRILKITRPTSRILSTL